jgi:hypothetical protein
MAGRRGRCRRLAVFPATNGEQVITRYTLGQLLDKLDELTASANHSHAEAGRQALGTAVSAPHQACFSRSCHRRR